MKKIFIILTLIVITSCKQEPIQEDKTNNNQYKMVLMFEYDGCKFYKFYDFGRAVYWTDCRGKIETVYTETSGKVNDEIRIQNETTY